MSSTNQERSAHSVDRASRLIDRRAVLRGLLGAGTLLTLPNTLQGDTFPGQDVVTTLGEIARNFTPGANYDFSFRSDGPDPLFSDRQLCVADNPRLKPGYRGPKHTTAAMVVHAGYVDYTIASLPSVYRNFSAERLLRNADNVAYWRDIVAGKLGNYYTHRDHLVRLAQILGRTTAPVAYCVESADAYNPTTPMPALAPPENAFVALTADASSNFADAFWSATITDYREQEVGLLFDKLKEQGVSTILMAGEFSFNSDNTLACLGGVAANVLEHGFKVQGIDGAVFPTIQPSGITESEAVRRALYENSVSLAAVPGLLS